MRSKEDRNYDPANSMSINWSKQTKEICFAPLKQHCKLHDLTEVSAVKGKKKRIVKKLMAVIRNILQREQMVRHESTKTVTVKVIFRFKRCSRSYHYINFNTNSCNDVS